jgi:hypothetical protein
VGNPKQDIAISTTKTGVIEKHLNDDENNLGQHILLRNEKQGDLKFFLPNLG